MILSQKPLQLISKDMSCKERLMELFGVTEISKYNLCL